MKRFVIAAALAVGLSFAFAETASAGIVYGYSVPRGGGVMSGGTYLSPALATGLPDLLFALHRDGDEPDVRPKLPRPGLRPDVHLQPVDRTELQRLLPAELLVQSLRGL